MSVCVLSFPATVEGCVRASTELRQVLDARAVADKPRYDAELVFEEIVSNVIRHGSPNGASCAIELSVDVGERAIVMSFVDDGRPFDPRSYVPPPRPKTLAEAQPGGLGLLLVRRAVSRIDYERTHQDRNRTTVTIALPGGVQ